jgi:hypothetical protein
MELPELNEANAPPGTEMRPHDVTYDEEEVHSYLARTGESLDAYRVDGRLYVPPGVLLAQPVRIVHANFFYETGVHVSSNMRVHAAPPVGETLTVRGQIGDLFERNGNKYVRLDVQILDTSGASVADIEHISIYKLKGSRGRAP